MIGDVLGVDDDGGGVIGPPVDDDLLEFLRCPFAMPRCAGVGISRNAAATAAAAAAAAISDETDNVDDAVADDGDGEADDRDSFTVVDSFSTSAASVLCVSIVNVGLFCSSCCCSLSSEIGDCSLLVIICIGDVATDDVVVPTSVLTVVNCGNGSRI